MTSSLLGFVSIVTQMSDLVLLTLRECFPCLGVIWCPAVPPLDLGILQNRIRVSEVVGKRWGSRLLDRHLLNICGGHTLILTCDDMGYSKFVHMEGKTSKGDENQSERCRYKHGSRIVTDIYNEEDA